ncbi:putative short chain type protein [Eutypa lata UCREL1]|uniref:Putative short chain type protein n=1 Tax=Eutypa lata (strain UCR-EL1) TaxID=1287681 RepID=M7TF32_EUTLA|nr:putative short chain type protein [Eutypa lata UCREL1]
MPADTLSLAGKIAIVTGSGRENGIGAGIALALGRNGASVTINYVSDSSAKRAHVLADKVRAVGGQATVVQASVVTPEGAQRIVQETLEAFGTDHIDILVNNAGIGWQAATLDHKPEDISRVLDINVKGPVLVAQATVPHMPPGGRIINITSTASKLGIPDLPVYGASKAAMDSLTSSWAREWGRSRGLTVNSVAPGPVLTDMIPSEKVDRLERWQTAMARAAERPGTIEDIGDAVLLLASEKSRWITGQYISVSGGVTN